MSAHNLKQEKAYSVWTLFHLFILLQPINAKIMSLPSFHCYQKKMIGELFQCLAIHNTKINNTSNVVRIMKSSREKVKKF